MFNKIRLSFKIFLSNLSLNTIIVLQLVAMLVMGNMIIAIHNSRFECLRLTKNSNEDGIYVYLPEDKEVYNNPNSKINNYIDFYSLSFSRIYDVGLWDDSNALVVGYGEDISKLLKKQLSKGKWFTDFEKEDDIINCVIAGNTKDNPIGSIINATGFLGGEIVDGHIQDCMQNIKFRVCGYIDENPCIMQMSVVSTELTADDLFKKYKTTSGGLSDILYNGGVRNKKDSSRDIIILCEDQLNDVVNLGSYNAILKFKDNISNDKKMEILELLKNEAIVTSLGEIQADTIKIINEDFNMYIPLIICFVTMGILGIICISIMTMIKNKNTLNIFINCGMKKIDGMKVLIGYFIILVFCLIMAFMITWAILLSLQILPWDSMLINLSNYVFSLGSLVVLILIMYMTESPFLKKLCVMENERC